MIGLVIIIYLALGILFAVAFFVRGHRIIDPSSKGASAVTRLLWCPAALALWPILTLKWVTARGEA